MIERMTEQRTVTLDSGIVVKGLIDTMSGIEAVSARWPDDFAVIFRCTTAILDDVPVLEWALDRRRKQAERHPLALWCAWGWVE